MESFFSSVINFRGREFGEAILAMAPTQPLVRCRETFIAEVGVGGGVGVGVGVGVDLHRGGDRDDTQLSP